MNLFSRIDLPLKNFQNAASFAQVAIRGKITNNIFNINKLGPDFYPGKRES